MTRLSLWQLSVWLEHGCGGSMRGALWTLGLTILQVILTLFISMYAVLGEEFEWAKRLSLGLMIAVQLAMACWALLADPIDRLEGLITFLVSLVEASATGLLLVAAYMQDVADKSVLKMIGGLSTAMLMATVFVPIALSIYDSILCPAAAAIQTRKEVGQSTSRAVAGILMQLIVLPLVIIAAVLGWNFKRFWELLD